MQLFDVGDIFWANVMSRLPWRTLLTLTQVCSWVRHADEALWHLWAERDFRGLQNDDLRGAERYVAAARKQAAWWSPRLTTREIPLSGLGGLRENAINEPLFGWMALRSTSSLLYAAAEELYSVKLSGQESHELLGRHRGPITCLACTKDIAVTGEMDEDAMGLPIDDPEVRIWDLGGGDGQTLDSPMQSSVWAVSILPESSCIVAGAHGGELKAWDLNTGRTKADTMADLEDVSNHGIWDAGFGCGNVVVCVGWDGLLVWDMRCPQDHATKLDASLWNESCNSTTYCSSAQYMGFNALLSAHNVALNQTESLGLWDVRKLSTKPVHSYCIDEITSPNQGECRVSYSQGHIVAATKDGVACWAEAFPLNEPKMWRSHGWHSVRAVEVTPWCCAVTGATSCEHEHEGCVWTYEAMQPFMYLLDINGDPVSLKNNLLEDIHDDEFERVVATAGNDVDSLFIAANTLTLTSDHVVTCDTLGRLLIAYPQ